MTQDAENWDRLQALFHLPENTLDDDLDALLLASEPEEELRRRARALIVAGRKKLPARPRQLCPATLVRTGSFDTWAPVGWVRCIWWKGSWAA